MLLPLNSTLHLSLPLASILCFSLCIFVTICGSFYAMFPFEYVPFPNLVYLTGPDNYLLQPGRICFEWYHLEKYIYLPLMLVL